MEQTSVFIFKRKSRSVTSECTIPPAGYVLVEKRPLVGASDGSFLFRLTESTRAGLHPFTWGRGGFFVLCLGHELTSAPFQMELFGQDRDSWVVELMGVHPFILGFSFPRSRTWHNLVMASPIQMV